MRIFAIILSVLCGSYSLALAQNAGSGASTGTHTPPSAAGTAGTNANGNVHTNQGNTVGSSAAGAQTEGVGRTANPTNSVHENRVPETIGNPVIQSGKVK
jgi:hypothetical protein